MKVLGRAALSESDDAASIELKPVGHGVDRGQQNEGECSQYDETAEHLRPTSGELLASKYARGSKTDCLSRPVIACVLAEGRVICIDSE